MFPPNHSLSTNELTPHPPTFHPKVLQVLPLPCKQNKSVVFLVEGNLLYIPLFLPHSSGWIGIDSCSKLIPRGKDFSNTGTLNNTHITGVHFLHSVGDIGPCGLVINGSCCETLGYKTLPSLSVFLREVFLCQPIPLSLGSQGQLRLCFQKNSGLLRDPWNTVDE